MAVTRGPIKTLEYSVDYDPTGPTPEATATWTEIPVRQLLNNNAQMPRETSTMAGLLDGAEASANKVNGFAFPIALRDDDTFLDALDTAENDIAGVWWRVTPSQGPAKVVGGQNGTVVSVEEAAIPNLGELDTVIVRGSVGGAIRGDTMVNSTEIT